MTQLLDAFGIKWSLLLAQAINFGIVLLALWYFLYKPVMEMMDKRRDVVAKGVEDARQAGEMLASADNESTKRINVAESQAENIISSARESASVEKARLIKEAEESAFSIAKDAELRAVETVERARRESEKDVARLAVLAAEKILSHSARATRDEHHD